MRGTGVNELLGLEWREHAGNPFIAPPFPSPIIADPTFLPPDDTPDGLWYLFAHSILGIHHFTSRDGLAWKRLAGAVCRASLRAFLLKRDGTYHIFYERFLRLFPFAYRSRLEVMTSRDLTSWSEPASGPRAHSPLAPRGLRGGGEQPLRGGGGGRLPPLLQRRPGLPAGLPLLGAQVHRDRLRPRGRGAVRTRPGAGAAALGQDAYANMGAGALKVLGADDGRVGFQNGIYWGPDRARSRSAIRLVASRDGLEWNILEREPVLKPGSGWKKAFVYALDVRRAGGRFHLYFNARDGWLTGRENIGLALGERVPSPF